MCAFIHNLKEAKITQNHKLSKILSKKILVLNTLKYKPTFFILFGGEKGIDIFWQLVTCYGFARKKNISSNPLFDMMTLMFCFHEITAKIPWMKVHSMWKMKNLLSKKISSNQKFALSLVKHLL